MQFYKLCLRALCLMCFLPVVCSAQTAVTSLRGTVHDPTGAVIPKAQVTISRPDIGFTQIKASDDRGEYSFVQIPPGRYTITASSDGFASQSQIADLLVNQPSTVNFTMTIAASTTIEVNTTATVLNTTDATIGTPFNSTQIQSLPFDGNNVLSLLSLQAGVLFLGNQDTAAQDQDSRSGAVNGARSDQSNVTLDGVDNNTQTKGYAFSGALRATRDSVEEFRVVTSNSQADSGRSSGAQIALVTRSGTNHLHGSAYEYYRPTNTVANDWFNKQAQVSTGSPNVPPKYLQNTYGASFGGPILRDKLFFFSSYEGQKTAENTQVTTLVPTDSFKNGLLSYVGTGGSVVTLDQSDLRTIDPKCGGNGSCPLGAGVNPAVLEYFSKYPSANGNADGDGYNRATYTFSSPSPISLTTYIVKLDYNLSNKQRLFVRGNLQSDNSLSPLQFPGSIPNSQTYTNSKGISGGHVWTISDSLINNLRYGFIRQGFANRGATNSDYVTFNSITSLQSTSNTSQIVNVPVHNIIDDVTWTKGRHTLQFGGNYRLIFNNRQSDTTLYKHANITYSYLTIGSIAGTGTSLDPKAFGYTAVDSSFKRAYNIAAADITGLITHAVQYYNYTVNSDSLDTAPAGQWNSRHFLSNEVEYYVQDTWKAKPNLTFTFGLRHSLLQAPYERNGQQVAPTISLNKWFKARADQAALGNTVQPEISFAQGGQANSKPGLWNMDKLDIAPRFSFAYSPNSRLSIRGGYGLYYDHFGVGVVDSFDERGSFGLSSAAQNGVNQSVDTAPRFSSFNAVPTSIIPAGGASGKFPVTPPATQDIYWGVDDKLHTPYAHVFDFSIQQEIGKGTTFELAYTGRLGRHLLQMFDLAMPLNLVDTVSGSDYFTAATQMSKYVDKGLTSDQVTTIPYWENMFPLAAHDGRSATQNIYENEWQYFRGNETAGLYDMDLGLDPETPSTQLFRYFNPQYSSLFAWSSMGTSSYHSFQAALHHPLSHGVQFDLYYTLSKSLDLGSDAERSSTTGSLNASVIINSFNPKQNKAVSDFDVRHALTGNFLTALPFGRGARFVPNANRLVDTFIGGWSLNGLIHLTSGLPFGTLDGNGWGTNWDYQSWNVATGPIQSGGHHSVNGQPNAFKDPEKALANIRAPYPGEMGERNYFRGDGFYSLDAGMSKVFHIVEGHQLKFAAEAFNVTNSVRFDTNSISNDPFGSAATFGNYGSEIVQQLFRHMQFSLRYSF